MPNYELKLELIDENTKTNASNVFTVTLTKERMTVNGSHFGFPDRCYLPIFADWENQESNSEDYYLGSHTMYEEYVVYDNTPFQVNST